MLWYCTRHGDASEKSYLQKLYKPGFTNHNKKMKFNFSLFFLAVGLAFALEAVFWISMPAKIRKVVNALLLMTDSQLRTWGGILLAIGVGLCFIGRFLKG